MGYNIIPTSKKWDIANSEAIHKSCDGGFFQIFIGKACEKCSSIHRISVWALTRIIMAPIFLKMLLF